MRDIKQAAFTRQPVFFEPVISSAIRSFLKSVHIFDCLGMFVQELN